MYDITLNVTYMLPLLGKWPWHIKLVHGDIRHRAEVYRSFSCAAMKTKEVPDTSFVCIALHSLTTLHIISYGCWHHYAFDFIFSKMGIIISKRGRFAASSFMHIFIIRDMWWEIPGGILMRRPSSATWWAVTQPVWLLTQWDTPTTDAPNNTQYI